MWQSDSVAEWQWQSGRVAGAEWGRVPPRLGSPARHACGGNFLLCQTRELSRNHQQRHQAPEKWSHQLYTQGLGTPSDTPVLTNPGIYAARNACLGVTLESHRIPMPHAMFEQPTSKMMGQDVGAHHFSK